MDSKGKLILKDFFEHMGRAEGTGVLSNRMLVVEILQKEKRIKK